MKNLVLLSILFLAGCQITVAKLPEPLDPQLVGVLKNHEETLAVLADEYKKRHPELFKEPVKEDVKK